ncbi:MAG: glycosyltransferase family 2 protein [Verrucomicrobiales bacterium]|nr:glycosyltransferase family 2 protein [Verrucomicrobiales bacterium]
MRLTLVINTFNQPEYLARVLAAVSRQTRVPDEVVLADDGSGEETRQVFEGWRAQGPLPGVHVWQEQKGFRRSRILNLAIAASTGEHLVFLDGDTVPHPRFTEDHLAVAARGGSFFVQGHRALVEREAAAWFGLGEFGRDRRRALVAGQISGWKNAFRWPAGWVRERSDLHGIRGCNLAIRRADLVRVNGYNEAFEGWGREDSELAVRLMNAGVRRLDMRGRAPCFHLWHPPASRSNLGNNDQILAQAMEQQATWCASGLEGHLPGRTGQRETGRT